MPKDFTDDPRGTHPETPPQEPDGDSRGSLDWIERRAIREGWLSMVDERMPKMVNSLMDDTEDVELEARDRHRAFTAVNTAVHRQRMYSLAKQRADLVIFGPALPDEPKADEGDVVEGAVLTPEAVAQQLIAMQGKIAEPTEGNDE